MEAIVYLNIYKMIQFSQSDIEQCGCLIWAWATHLFSLNMTHDMTNCSTPTIHLCFLLGVVIQVHNMYSRYMCNTHVVHMYYIYKIYTCVSHVVIHM